MDLEQFLLKDDVDEMLSCIHFHVRSQLMTSAKLVHLMCCSSEMKNETTNSIYT